MVVSIIINILLALALLYIVYKLNQRTKEKEQIEKQEKREWLLKVALEQSCQVPTVEPDELSAIEPEINRLMNAAKTDKNAEKKIRDLIMGLYEQKVNARKAEAQAQVKAAHQPLQQQKPQTPPSQPPNQKRYIS
jgi:hypothetical protein